ncbi:hypothetical protein ACFYZ2_39375 [Streptomyces sviceus]|uniref:hypothetical protein n=1 Tax=Streptomyces sviceus TaxID=285530 RepID=UPI0036930F3D
MEAADGEVVGRGVRVVQPDAGDLGCAGRGLEDVAGLQVLALDECRLGLVVEGVVNVVVGCAPGGGLGGQPVGDRGGVAALDLAEQAVSADRVDEADVLGVRDEFPLLRVRVLHEEPSAPDLVKPRLQYRQIL